MSNNRGTDTRPPFFSIEESVIDDYDLHPLAGWLYVVIVRHINRKKNDAFPSIARLARIAKMSKASVLRYTKVLEELGLIEVIREKDDSGEKQVNHYRLLTATRVVSDSNYGSIQQQQPVVSDSNINHKKINQTNLTTEKKEIPAPIVADAAETIEPTIVEANTPALPIGEGKILAFPSAIETTEDTPPRAEFHAVTAAALGITGAAYPIIEKWVNFLTGNTLEYTTPRGKKKPTYNGKFYELQVTPGMSIDEIGAFGRWYRATHPGKTPYTTCEGLNVDTAKFRAAKDHDRYVDRFHHDRTDVIIVDDSALPKAAGAEGDAIPITADKRAEAERIMAELLAKMNGNGVKRDTNRQ
jgi:DNA-binding transcriptional ArsR family regulator